jgi:hypothetical protein
LLIELWRLDYGKKLAPPDPHAYIHIGMSPSERLGPSQGHTK